MFHAQYRVWVINHNITGEDMEHPYGEDDWAKEAMKRKYLRNKYLRNRKKSGLTTKAYVWIRSNNVEKESIFDNTIVVKTAMFNILGWETI